MRLFLQGNLASRIMEGAMKPRARSSSTRGSTAPSSRRRRRSSSRISPSASACSSMTTCSTSSARSSTASATAPCTSERPKDHHLRANDRGRAAPPPRVRRLRRERRRGPRPLGSRASSAGSTPTSLSVVKVEEFKSAPRSFDTDRCRISSSRIKQAYALKESVEIPAALGGLGALHRHQRHRPPLAGAPHRDGGAQAAPSACAATARRTRSSEYKGEAFKLSSRS